MNKKDLVYFLSKEYKIYDHVAERLVELHADQLGKEENLDVIARKILDAEKRLYGISTLPVVEYFYEGD